MKYSRMVCGLSPEQKALLTDGLVSLDPRIREKAAKLAFDLDQKAIASQKVSVETAERRTFFNDAANHNVLCAIYWKPILDILLIIDWLADRVGIYNIHI